MSRILIFLAILAVLAGAAYPVAADCLQSCTAHLSVHLSYQPEGQPDRQRRTRALKINQHETRTGRYKGTCDTKGLLKAKHRACLDAVKALKKRFHSPRAQQAAICIEINKDARRPNNLKIGFPEADWYSIDQLVAIGKKARVKKSASLRVEKNRFGCEEGLVTNPPSREVQEPETDEQDDHKPPQT